MTKPFKLSARLRSFKYAITGIWTMLYAITGIWTMLERLGVNQR